MRVGLVRVWWRFGGAGRTLDGERSHEWEEAAVRERWGLGRVVAVRPARGVMTVC